MCLACQDGKPLCDWAAEMKCVQQAVNIDPEQLERDLGWLQVNYIRYNC
eukprot:COSAG01_NODE_11178_length_1989_cov_1.797354_3_plen_49_part_00